MYLVSYDIDSNRMRRKVSDTLENYGIRIQYSVFECDLTEKRFQTLYEELAKLTIGLESGSVRFYYICANCQKKVRVIGSEKKKKEWPDEDVIVL